MSRGTILLSSVLKMLPGVNPWALLVAEVVRLWTKREWRLSPDKSKVLRPWLRNYYSSVPWDRDRLELFFTNLAFDAIAWDVELRGPDECVEE